MPLKYIFYQTTKRIKMIVPAVIIFGAAPSYYLVWLAWKALSLFLPPWVYQKGDDVCYCLYQRFVLFFFENLTKVEVIFHGDVHDVVKKKERIIYMSNHQSSMDWIVAHMLAERQGSLGHVRYIMKNSLQAIPLYGFYFYQHGCIFVRRGNFSDNKMKLALEYVQDKNIPSWLVIFPEGTRFNPAATETLEKSQQFAQKKGLHPYTHVLTPRIRGLHLSLDSLRNTLDAIYDVTVVYSSTLDSGVRTKAPSMFEMITGGCEQLHIHVNRIDISVVPKTEEELQQWLFSLYREKDKLLKEYYEKPTTSEAFSNGVRIPVKLLHTFGSFAVMVMISLPLLVTAYGRSVYWKTWCLGSLAGYIWLGIKSLA